MTDKEIIIDGVNVAGCERYCSDNYNTPNMCYSDMTNSYRSCNPKENQCNFYITSIEQQLRRKEQECEELKEELQMSKDDHAYAVEFEKDIERYKQALEKIKELVTITSQMEHSCATETIFEIINEVKNEDSM